MVWKCGKNNSYAKIVFDVGAITEFRNTHKHPPKKLHSLTIVSDKEIMNTKGSEESLNMGI